MNKYTLPTTIMGGFIGAIYILKDKPSNPPIFLSVLTSICVFFFIGYQFGRTFDPNDFNFPFIK